MSSKRLGERIRRRILFALVIALVVSAGIATWRGARAHFAPSVPLAVRLHVVPNSDSRADQQLKLAVRDALRPVAERIMANNGAGQRLGADAAKGYAESLRAAAEVELQRAQSEYRVEAFTEFDERGEPVAFRVVIGAGRGANWFCVLVPPLCFADLEPIEKVSPPPGEDPDEEGIYIGWRWLGKWFGGSSVPLESVGDVDQDDVHPDLAHTTPRDGDVGLAGE